MAYTTIDDPSVYFQTKLYTGTGSSQAYTNDGNSDLQPDWLWIKIRSSADGHHLFDSSRGVTKRIHTDSSSAEVTISDGSNLTAIGSDGFTLGGNGGVNGSSSTYVAWQWKANGGTTTTNDASATSVGTIDSVYQANTTAGFSIVTYTGTTSAGTIAHGLGAVPRMIIIKNRDDGAENWAVYHAGIASDAETDYLYLDSTNAAADDANLFNDTAPTSTVFSIGTSGVVNQAEAHIAYCFAEIKGYSKIGSYTGNGNADGPFLYLGFRPKFIIIKRTDTTGSWFLIDSVRDINTLGAANTKGSAEAQHQQLFADASDAEATYNSSAGDFLSNGYKLKGTNASTNASGGTFIYLAFAEHPLVSSKGVPTTAV